MGIGEALPDGWIRLRQADPLFPGLAEPDRIAVLGLGNVLLSDEGAGVHAATELGKRYRFLPSIDIIDGGTMGLDLLPLFQDRNRILIIDAVDFGKHPGYTDLLEGSAIPAVLNTKLSVHHIGLADLLFASKLVRERPLDVCLVGIQPESLKIGLDMSRRISSQMQSVLNIVLRKLQSWSVRCEESGRVESMHAPKPDAIIPLCLAVLTIPSLFMSSIP